MRGATQEPWFPYRGAGNGGRRHTSSPSITGVHNFFWRLDEVEYPTLGLTLQNQIARFAGVEE